MTGYGRAMRSTPRWAVRAKKIDKWSAAPLPQTRATLQQGLPLRRERDAAGQFWTFTMSNSGRKASTFAETMNPGVELRMHVVLTRIASGDARHRRHVSDARSRSRAMRVQRWRKPVCRELFRAIWSLLPVRRRVLARRRLVRFSRTLLGLLLR